MKENKEAAEQVSFSAVALGENLRRIREEKGMNAETLAYKIGRFSSTIRNYEKGRTAPGAGDIVALCKALGVSADTLLMIEEGAE